MAEGNESALSLTNFDDIDEEDRAGRKTRLFKRNETQGYIDTTSLDAASVDKVSYLLRLLLFARAVTVIICASAVKVGCVLRERLERR